MARLMIENIVRFSIPVNSSTKPFFKFLYKVHVFTRESLLVLVKIIYFEPLFRSQCEKVGKGLWMEKLPYLNGKGKIVIGDFVRLSGKQDISFSRKLYPNPELTIGDHTFVGGSTVFAAAKKIKIGQYCYIAGGVYITDNDGHPLDAKKRRNNEPPLKNEVKEVEIGDDVWIGRQAIILKGVTIGDRVLSFIFPRFRMRRVPHAHFMERDSIASVGLFQGMSN